MQEVELQGGEAHVAPVDAQLAADRVELEAVEAQDAVVRRRTGAGRVTAAAQHGPDPGDDLARAERLGHVVVRPGREPDERVDLLGARRDEDDVDVRRATHRPQHVEAVEVRQTDVEQDEVGGAAVRRERPAQRLGAGARLGHEMALGLEVGAQHGADLGLVVDDEDAARHPTSCG